MVARDRLKDMTSARRFRDSTAGSKSEREMLVTVSEALLRIADKVDRWEVRSAADLSPWLIPSSASVLRSAAQIVNAFLEWEIQETRGSESRGTCRDRCDEPIEMCQDCPLRSSDVP